jgi:hypothetical protein
VSDAGALLYVFPLFAWFVYFFGKHIKGAFFPAKPRPTGIIEVLHQWAEAQRFEKLPKRLGKGVLDRGSVRQLGPGGVYAEYRHCRRLLYVVKWPCEPRMPCMLEEHHGGRMIKIACAYDLKQAFEAIKTAEEIDYD